MIVKELRLGAIGTVKGEGKCPQIESIRVADIPSDFVPPVDYKNFSFELRTATGCNSEFPVWVAWNDGETILAFGKYRWK